MTTGIWPRELLISRIEILHIWIWCTNLMFMMKNKKLSFQNLQVASDVMNLKIISVKIWPRELLISRIEILHIWIWCTNLMFMMKNKKLSFQNLQVASDVMNLKIISVKMSIWIPKMPKSLMRSLCAWLMRDNFKQTINSSRGHLTTSAICMPNMIRSNHSFDVFTC